jgi:hypothetical protein
MILYYGNSSAAVEIGVNSGNRSIIVDDRKKEFSVAPI